MTGDGSETIQIPDMHVTYHSVHGAIQESKHVFIQTGLMPLVESKQFETINIFEMGFGTGLNALLSYDIANEFRQKIRYATIELFPLQKSEYALLSYSNKKIIQQLHETKWEENIALSEYFLLHKTNQSLLDFFSQQQFQLIYYDAFAPAAQPELWTEEIFSKLFAILGPKGVLVTYCSKSIVQKAMRAAGFTLEKVPGPPGKREIVKATKPII